MRLGLKPPSGIREPLPPPHVAAARVEVPSLPASGLHRELLIHGAPSDTPLARSLARAVQRRVSTAAADPRGITAARVARQAPDSSAAPVAGDAATDRMAFVRFWTEIEMDVGNTAAHDDLYASFIRNAEAVERDPVFNSVVHDMYEQIDDLIAAYVDGFTIDQMAENAGF
jgi:hypothetical protein